MLQRLSVALASLTLASGVLLAGIHLNDLYAAHHVPGIWMALARSLNQGMFYPPVESDGFYAGTRYCPLFFVLIARLSWLTPTYLVAAKLASAISILVLLTGIFTAIRQCGGNLPDAVALACLPLAIPQGLAALLLPQADALAAGLAVWGLVTLGLYRWDKHPCLSGEEDKQGCLSQRTTPPRIGLAAFLFTLAVFTKFSTLAAPAAAFLWLLLRDRRSAFVLTAACLLLGGLGLGLVQWLSDGRFLDNLRQLGGGGATAADILYAPLAFFNAFLRSLGFIVLFPFLIVAVVFRFRQRRAEVWDLYFLTALGLCFLVYTSPGTADNHLLELEVAGVLVLGRALATSLLGVVPRAAVLLVFALGVMPHLGTWKEGAAEGVITSHQIDEKVPLRASLLAETPLVPVLRGQRPVVMDAFAFHVLAERGRIDDQALAERIRRHEFDVLIMLGRIDEPGKTLCPQFHFGERVTRAILESYHYDETVGVFALFVPNR